MISELQCFPIRKVQKVDEELPALGHSLKIFDALNPANAFRKFFLLSQAISAKGRRPALFNVTSNKLTFLLPVILDRLVVASFPVI